MFAASNFRIAALPAARIEAHFFFQLKYVPWVMPSWRQTSAIDVPSSPCLMMNAFCASVNRDAFIALRSSLSQRCRNIRPALAFGVRLWEALSGEMKKGMTATAERFLGTVSQADPLHECLRHIFARPSNAPTEISVYQLDGRGAVFRYLDRASERSVVGKFYGRKISDDVPDGPALRTTFMRREFANLQHLRDLGFDRSPMRVVRPLAIERDLDWVLIHEYAPGTDLLSAVDMAASARGARALQRRIVSVAQFLAALHQRSRTNAQVDAGTPLSYLDKLIDQIAAMELLSPNDHDRFRRASVRWAVSGLLARAPEVLVHGDATPPHFLFEPGSDDLVVIDVERLWPGDAAADVGCLAAELRYLFWRAGACGSEQQIRWLCTSYFDAGGDSSEDFMRRVHFYQGCYQLRISRNVWIAPDLKRRLVADAAAHLDSRP